MAKDKKGISAHPHDIYKKALMKWGYRSQVGMLHEEVGELFQALNKFSRKKATTKQVIDEIADAWIMVEQMAMAFGMAEAHHRKIEKLIRLEKLLSK